MTFTYSMVLQVTCASIIFGLGLGCIVLVAEAADTMNKYANGGTVYPQDIRFSHGSLLSYIPEQWVTAGNNSVLAAGVFSVLAGFSGFVLLAVQDFYMTVVGGFIVLSSTITAVFALIYSMVSYYSNDNEWGYYDQYSTNGTYTVEGWTCTLSQVLVDEQKDFSEVCTESNTARYLTIALFAINISFLVFMVLIMRQRYRQWNGSGSSKSKVSSSRTIP